MTYHHTLVEYNDIVARKYENGEISYDKLLRLLDKLMQWEYMWKEDSADE